MKLHAGTLGSALSDIGFIGGGCFRPWSFQSSGFFNLKYSRDWLHGYSCPISRTFIRNDACRKGSRHTNTKWARTLAYPHSML